MTLDNAKLVEIGKEKENILFEMVVNDGEK